nr:MAG TPA: hypothetical protein [Caudoviricetes sp.]
MKTIIEAILNKKSIDDETLANQVLLKYIVDYDEKKFASTPMDIQGNTLIVNVKPYKFQIKFPELLNDFPEIKVIDFRSKIRKPLYIKTKGCDFSKVKLVNNTKQNLDLSVATNVKEVDPNIELYKCPSKVLLKLPEYYFAIDLDIPRLLTTNGNLHKDIKKVIDTNYKNLPDKKMTYFFTGIKNSGAYDSPTYILKGVSESDLGKYYPDSLKTFDQYENKRQYKDVWYFYSNER